MSAGRRSRFHQATRGGVGRDEAERERRVARTRMLHTLGEHVRALSPAAAVFVGGTPQLVSEAMGTITAAGVQRVIEAPSLGARARVSEIARAVHEGLAQVQRDADSALVEELERRYADDGLGLAGAAATGRALDERSVQMLVLSETFVTAQPEVAEVFVRSALAQDALVRVVADDASRMLEESGGAGALLRFSPFRTQPLVEGELVTA
jgi:stalled ribosome rescue protein Dom34